MRRKTELDELKKITSELLKDTRIAEDAKLKADNLRKESEEIRKLAEEARIKAEEARILADKARDLAEKLREKYYLDKIKELRDG